MFGSFVRKIVGHGLRSRITRTAANRATQAGLYRSIMSKTFAAPSALRRLMSGTIGFGAVALSAVGLSLTAFAHDDIPFFGKPGSNHERTFIAVKPDGVQRGLVGDIIRRFESKGYRLVAIKMVHPTKDFAEKHYDDLKTKPFFPGLVSFFSSGPVVAMVWQGKGVIAGGRRLLGATNPDDSAPGTIRGDLCVTVGRNVCHGSDGPDSAQDEIKLWFGEKEVVHWHSGNEPWVYEKP